MPLTAVPVFPDFLNEQDSHLMYTPLTLEVQQHNIDSYSG